MEFDLKTTISVLINHMSDSNLLPGVWREPRNTAITGRSAAAYAKCADLNHEPFTLILFYFLSFNLIYSKKIPAWITPYTGV